MSMHRRSNRSSLVVFAILVLISRTIHSMNPENPALDSNPEFGDVPKVPAGVPVFPRQEMMNLSPEQLVRASLPWQGMDTPWRQPGGPGAVGNAWRLSKFARANFATRQPWDTDSDVSQDAPFDNSQEAPVPGHPPPYYIGDGDHEAAKKLPDATWQRIVMAPPLLPNQPAQYGHGYKPAGYYRHPFKKLGTNNNAPVQSFLEMSENNNSNNRIVRKRRLRGASSFLELGSKPIDGMVRVSIDQLVGALPEGDPTNPTRTMPMSGPPAPPMTASLNSLHFDSYDAVMMRQMMGQAGEKGDLMLPPSRHVSELPDIFRRLNEPPAPSSNAYAKGLYLYSKYPKPLGEGLYPSKPPEPLFG